MASHDLPLSVLELAIVPEGANSRDSLLAAVRTAQRIEALGYRRMWVAEHHNMHTVASTSPAVLMAHLAAATTAMRIGSGGVMLPNHSPLVIAEQFALLEALHPGRIDLGVGRAPGTDRATAVVLRRTPDNRDDEDFPHHLIDLMGMLGDPRRSTGLWDHFRATPSLESFPTVFLLGSSGYSAELAGKLGLPFSFAHHFDMGGTTEAVEIYRGAFTPSRVLDEPVVLVTASVLAADDREAARKLSAPNRLRRLGMRTGRLLPLMTPDEALAHPLYPQAEAMETSSIVGTADEAVREMEVLVERTGADELMLFTSTHDPADRLHSFELLAQGWGLAIPQSDPARTG